MESSNRLLLLAVLLIGASLATGCASRRALEQQQTEEQAAAEEAAEEADSTPPRVIEPNVVRRKIKTPKIDNENWEIGAGAGFLSIEDFGTNQTYAAQLTYHVTEDFFFRGDLGQSTAGRTSFGFTIGRRRLADEERLKRCLTVWPTQSSSARPSGRVERRSIGSESSTCKRAVMRSRSISMTFPSRPEGKPEGRS